MKILSVSAKNFGSYESVNIDFTDKGLTLVSGPTGSGKSTLCDLIPWVLFGRTAKDGSVDEIRRWGEDASTKVTINLEINGGICQITRVRKPNDLYFEYPRWTNAPTRGKDLADTQKLINDLLGTDCDKYLSSSYYHEFSKVANFFTSTPKYRRQMTEQLVDLSLAKKVAESSLKTLAEVKCGLAWSTNEIKHLKGTIERLNKEHADYVTMLENWQTTHKDKLKRLRAQAQAFDLKEAAKDLEKAYSPIKKTCPTCGGPVKGKLTPASPVKQQNPYLYALNEAGKETCPLEDILEPIRAKIQTNEGKLATEIERLAELQQQQSDLEALGEIVSNFREMQIRNTIVSLQDATNRYLTSHFDAEIKVTFDLDGLDKLEVSLQKDGNECSYTQLSKGQRCLLKLCFGIAVMKHVANYSGVSTNVAFLDEALDGLDEVLKVKAFSLLKELALDYDALLVVEHSNALKDLFINKIEVSLVNGVSQIEEA